MTIFKSNSFQPAPNVSLYQALYTHLRSAILSCELKGGMKLPSTRALAEELNVSRNTVLNAYRQLLAEGYLESIKGSGTFIANVLPELLLTMPRHSDPEPGQPPRVESHPPMLSERATPQIAAPQLPWMGKLPRPFNAAGPALDAFPHSLWSRLVIRQARRMPVSNLTYQDSAGYLPLRKAIAAHLAISRQVHCTAEQVIIVPGAQAAFDLASRMLIKAGDQVWMEDPGYSAARAVFHGAGADIVPVPVDDDGLNVNIGVERAPRARLAYLTPSHQFPLGVTLALSRRLALLDWAKHADAYMLEDDYDSEFRFAGRPLASLQGLDDADRVIYIGTFSKVLFPAIRVGYVIPPLPLVEAFLKVRRRIDIHCPMLEQMALADFILEGHFTRHLRRMRTLYAERRKAFLEAAKELPLDIYSPEAGLHCVGWLPDGIDEAVLVSKARQSELDLMPISSFSIEPLKRKGLLLGYGAYSVQEIKKATDNLKALIESISILPSQA